jgi:hypothetical protein
MNVLSVGAATYLKPSLQAAPPKLEREPDADADSEDAGAVNAAPVEHGDFPPIGSTVDVRA